MSNERRCDGCGRELAANAPHGLCAACLFQHGLEPLTAARAPQNSESEPPTPAELAPHFPELEILEIAGRGGMGVVYKARQQHLDRLVALKILAPNTAREPAFAERFAREARAMAMLSHPHVVAVYDFGQVDGLFYFLMEFVDGVDLRRLLDTGQITPREALAIVPQICDALQYAHDHGVVHRDIKPENILLDREGRVKIADFGLAKLVGRETQDVTLTGTGQVMGTLHYMAPEQLEHPREVDHRADIYSLGVVFYQMLTGELPLGRFAPPSRKVQIDVRLDEVVLRALEKEPQRRYQHADEVKTELETIAAGPSKELPSHPTAARAPWLRRIAVVGRRGGRAVVHWPGVLLSLIITLAILEAAASLASLALEGRIAEHALLTAFFIGLMITGIRIRAGRVIPVDQLLSLDAPPPRPDTLWESGSRLALLAGIARWTARVLGTLCILLVLPFILAEGLPPIASQPEGVQLTFAAGALLFLGFVIGWWREGTAAVLIASGWTLFHISENHFGWSLFHLVLGIALLYAFCWWVVQGRKTVVLLTAASILVVALGLGRLFCPTSVFVRGTVTDSLTGKPVAHAELTVQRNAPPSGGGAAAADARSANDGRFTLYIGWYAEQKRLAVVAAGYEKLVTPLGPRSLGQRIVERDFRLQPLGAGGK